MVDTNGDLFGKWGEELISRATAGATLSSLVNAYQQSALVWTALQLDVFNILKGQSLSAEEIARKNAWDPTSSRAFLASLEGIQLIQCDIDGRYSLTELGAYLDPSKVADAAGGSLTTFEELYARWMFLPQVIKAGRIDVGDGGPQEYWNGFAGDKAIRSSFYANVERSLRDRTEEIVSLMEFGDSEHVVDVGGATGILLEEVLSRNRIASATLFERPEVAEDLLGRFVDSPIKVVPGDFFVSVPQGADAYILCRVLHDWDDNSAFKILRNVARAMPDHGRLYIVDKAVGEKLTFAEGLHDLKMLVLFGGHERSGADIRRILNATGLTLTKALPSVSALWVYEARIKSKEEPVTQRT